MASFPNPTIFTSPHLACTSLIVATRLVQEGIPDYNLQHAQNNQAHMLHPLGGGVCTLYNQAFRTIPKVPNLGEWHQPHTTRGTCALDSKCL